MKISTLPDQVDNGQIILPTFQLLYARNRDLVRHLPTECGLTDTLTGKPQVIPGVTGQWLTNSIPETSIG
ncbi:hypothetical protein L861_19555 [Litchfieldella anticariensis FP35 = DSM 16096]|uniref:Uncharacterized protein n=1 Tax=Litchfieldella anticariensis (strain DSM 16096 / CECT 5854 / CIP 108499 / LMG 22089 / FP35) TaxID=1121939 RepID=S2L2E4_LITA3|nr:hypothetical protein [Halomonas anticariensis]EPC01849.1 hypothetical protein L861_19555 [Halomonas anticariensis FP35 = DSM 16096]